ncbi:MAG TPA: protein phosphatase 2C domain-containing protein [Nocardioides sp.]|uniref:PP2C family protein-serine/threonine phosphatase n=1 Tax=Nocardioides sp. TaxID=35761 RepID=UPI002C46F6CC|nr:protein phosphatase 2C domain-containing protein [Nocardioides sp.]HQR26805.1 protein phosphatase 2C domain-containing protein [Nocardioides sp.]
MTDLRLQYSAISDVGRVRKDNQDSGYAGPWLLAVCDGVGGAVRGDIASSTAVSQLRRLDEQPQGDDLLALVAGALHRAADRIGELVEEDPVLSGTSTTATVALFDGHGLGMGHLGDSRAYLLRGGELTQLTQDHTFVQTLIDEGRITEDEARTHPHRNLILKALDGIHESEPDLFHVDLEEGDRLLLCSDGASGALTDAGICEILAGGTPDSAAVELVNASLEAGSTDNITCLVADVVPASTPVEEDLRPLLVGAAAELPRRAAHSHRAAGFFRHRSGDTGELEPIDADLPADIGFAISSDPIDPEHLRYAPRARPRFLWTRRLLVGVVLLGVVAIGLGVVQWWIQQQYYVGQQDGVVTIFRGLDGDLLGYDLSTPYQSTNLTVSQLPEVDQTSVIDSMEPGSLEDARRTVASLYQRQTVPGASSGG